MKKVLIYVFLISLAVIMIPMSYALPLNLSLNQTLNAFFACGYETLAFYFIQWTLSLLVAEMLLESEKTLNTTALMLSMLVFLGMAIWMKGNLYALCLAIVCLIGKLVIGHKKNQLDDEITGIIHDVKKEYLGL